MQGKERFEMKQRSIFILAILVMAHAGLDSSFAMASRTGARTVAPALLAMPAQFATLQLGFDIAERHSTVLVAYQSQGVGREPLLHVWDGAQWVRVGLQDMRTFSFMSVAPSRVLLVGDENTLPDALVEATSGSVSQYVLPSTDTATMVNHFGHFYDFRPADWRWFAARYDLQLSDLNQPRREGSWYAQPTEEVPAFPLRPNRRERRRAIRSRYDREAERAPAPVVEAPVMPPERTIRDVSPVRPAPVAPAPAPSPTPALTPPAEPEAVIELAPIHRSPEPPEASIPEIPADWEERAVATEAPPVK